MASEDAAALRKAMKGWGTDEKKLTEIMGNRSNAQLVAIKEAYNTELKRDLIKDIKSETSGHYEDVLVGLLTETAEYDATLVHKAVKGLGTDEHTLSEVLCSRHADEIQAMCAAYKRLFKSDLISDVEDDTSGNLEKVYNLVITGKKQEHKAPDDSQIPEDVQALFKAGEDKIGTNEGVFIRILAENPRAYVEKLYWAYAKEHGKALDAVVKSEFSGAVKSALMALCTPPDIYFAKRLLGSMKGLGTNDKELIRIIVSQKERHLKAAAERFLQDNKKTLRKWVESECSGDYKKILVATIQNFAERD
jgi:annexin A7/11